MKRATILCLFLLLSGTALATASRKPNQDDKDFQVFWQYFKTAVTNGDKDAVVGLSRFPIRMPGRVRNIKDAADLRARYAEVFKKYLNAAKCFSTDEGKGELDPANPKQAFAGCIENSGPYDVHYVFQRTSTGWKLVQLFRELLPD